MEVSSHQYSPNGFFHNFGIDHMDTYAARGQWKLRRLATIMKELGHSGVGKKMLNYYGFVCMRLC
jgi:hypothetical protein